MPRPFIANPKKATEYSRKWRKKNAKKNRKYMKAYMRRYRAEKKQAEMCAGCMGAA
jgi:hypothetical protein